MKIQINLLKLRAASFLRVHLFFFLKCFRPFNQSLPSLQGLPHSCGSDRMVHVVLQPVSRKGEEEITEPLVADKAEVGWSSD